MGITYLQLFAIGFSFGLAGPCLLVCTPILIAYLAGIQAKCKHALIDIFVFLLGRLLAYLVLGYLAGLSAVILRQFCNSTFIPFIKLAAGTVIILLGVYLLLGKEPFSWPCKGKAEIFNFSSLFILGFIIGIFPCAPLMALLLEITLISKSAFSGMIYALFFGLGTLISGVLVMGALSGIISGVAAKILKSKKSNLIFRIICSLLLIWLGIKLAVFKIGAAP